MDDLDAGLINAATAQMASITQTLMPADSIEQSLSSFLDNFRRYLKAKQPFLKLQLMLMPELRQVVIGPQQQRAALLLRVLSDWLRQAKVPQPKAKAQLFLAMLGMVLRCTICASMSATHSRR